MTANHSNYYVKVIDLALSAKLKKDLKEQGFEFTIPDYTLFSAKKKGVVCTLYQTGKLVVQGKERAEFIEFYLEPEIIKEFSFSYPSSSSSKKQFAGIGIDESGKGDFFGPLCIAGVYAAEEDIARLKDLGVCDSKQLNDTAILSLAPEIRKRFVHHVIRINPLKYNQLYEKFKNLNRLLAWGHATTIENLVERTSCKEILIDQFASEDVVATALLRKKLELNLKQMPRGEENLVVAAASILAREAFLMGLKELSQLMKVSLPKGASSIVIKIGKELYKEGGIEALKQCAKMHFKTSAEIINSFET